MKTILVIEDNEEVRENTAELLTLNNYSVVTASNGNTGFGLAKSVLPDLILCDMMMPESDGQKFLEMAKADSEVQWIPLLFFSAGTPLPVVQRQLISASNGFLKKPFLEEELLLKIETVLAR
jgi:CheY-like chemotaxis protein